MTGGEAGQVRKVLAVFRERPLSLDAERLEQRRARLVPRLRAEVRARHAAELRRRRLRRIASVLALAAAVVLAAGLAWKVRLPSTDSADSAVLIVEDLSGESSLWSGVEQHRLVLGETLKFPVQGQLRTAEVGWARLRTRQGLALGLAGGTAVELGELRGVAGERRVFLSRGELSCEVPKLPVGEQFVVVTPDARVVVHGTAFTVRVAPSGASGTCVRVQHGVVSVHRAGQTIVLNGGEGWGCEQTAVREPAGERAKAAVAEALPARRPGEARSAAKAPEARPSTLAQETSLLQTALAAERRGDFASARRNLRALVDRFPSSPLAAEAEQALERVSR
jgi:ferric-dicitrate binding protein FerR (iron transport regulator)